MVSQCLNQTMAAPLMALTADALTFPLSRIPLTLWMRPRTDIVYKGLFLCHLQPGQSHLNSSYEPIRSNAHNGRVRRVQIKTKLSTLIIPASPLTKEQNLLYLLTSESPGPAYLLVAPRKNSEAPNSQLPWPTRIVILS